MSFLHGLEIAASGLRAQRTRMTVISSNLANAETTRTEAGGAYRRKQVVLRAEAVNPGGFASTFDDALKSAQVDEITTDQVTPMNLVHDPGHPDANAQGYVELPNVDVLEEMVDMITTSRSYEASATAFDTLKSMAQRAIQIG